MKIISFAFTTPAFLAGKKVVTRREWDGRYAASFRKGEVCSAYDKSPRFGGVKVGEIKLTRAPYKERLAEMPDSDYAAEGFFFLHHGPKRHTPPRSSGFRDFSFEAFCAWRETGGVVWVVRFRVVSLEAVSGGGGP